MTHRAVIFDIGGVIVSSPMAGIARYERELGLASGFVNRHIVERGENGAWARLEQGRLSLEEFYPEFEAECADRGVALSARRLMEEMGSGGGVHPAMLHAVGRLRARGLRVGALTNNWKLPDRPGLGLEDHFDAFVESSIVGLSKPDPRIYAHTCERLGVAPTEAVFLDDVGRNLKPARRLGMTTIKVVDPEQALAELESVLGFALR